VYASYQLGQKVGVDSTPTLFINGRKIANPAGIPYETLKRLMLFEAQEAKAEAAKKAEQSKKPPANPSEE
jgi:hypothetical protein